jgi:FGGY family of carbohydrate kinases, N-terminal domain
MSCLLGIDLGTSSVKVVTFGVEGALKGVGLAEYPILTPRLGYAEQDPEQWWRATVTAVREALDKAGRPEILGMRTFWMDRTDVTNEEFAKFVIPKVTSRSVPGSASACARISRHGFSPPSLRRVSVR